MITNEEKCRIFAAYWGAEIESNLGHTKVSWQVMRYLDDSHKLLLKDLSAISDEDAIEVAKIAYPKLGWDNSPNAISAGKSILANTHTDMAANMFIKVIDYLRSKFYNCGYGKYSHQDLIDFNIVKIVA